MILCYFTDTLSLRDNDFIFSSHLYIRLITTFSFFPAGQSSFLKLESITIVFNNVLHFLTSSAWEVCQCYQRTETILKSDNTKVKE